MADPRDDLDPEHTPVSDDQPTSSVAPDMATADTAERFREFLATGDSVAPQLERSGDQVGPYRLLSLLGTGGFGSVWMAERREPFVQRVALKIVKAGMDSRSVVARFEQERQALAVMNHPNIAKVLDGGLTPQGRPYFAMELVKGEPITEFCDARRLGIKDRLRLFTRACEAVQHAHLKGVVHRDIKPSNILAFEVEGEEPSLKVIDFGVAKAMVQPLTDKTIFTETGQMIGTPAYMSPEQADPSSSDIDTRSDIYSLGALLYELVTGATPFDSQELRKRGYGEIQRILREEDPPSPSARLSTISTKNAELASRIEKARGVALRQLARELRSELEWIPLKAMRKEPLNRYQTAIELANDVRAYLDGQPIVAAPESRLYRVRKYVRRNRGPVAAASLVSGALLVGLSVATWQWRAADLARGAAEEARVVAEQSREEAVEQRDAAESQRKRVEKLSRVSSAGRALDAVRRGDFSEAKVELESFEQLGGDGFVSRLVRRYMDQTVGRVELDPDAYPLAYSFEGNSEVLMLISNQGVLKRVDVQTLRPVGVPVRLDITQASREGSPYLLAAKFDASGRVGVLCLGDESVHLVRDTVTSRVGQAEQLGLVHPVLVDRQIAVSSNGRVAAWIREKDQSAALMTYAIDEMRLIESRHLCSPADNLFLPIALSPDGCRVAFAAPVGDGVLVEPVDRSGCGTEGVKLDCEGEVGELAFSPDGGDLAIAMDDGSVEIRSAQNAQLRGRRIKVADQYLFGLVFSPDGKSLATCGVPSNCIYVWDAQTGELVGEPWSCGGDQIEQPCFSPSGEFLIAGTQNSLAIWNLDRPVYAKATVVKAKGEFAHSLSADGRTMAMVDVSDQRVWLYDHYARLIGPPILLPRGHAVSAIAFSPTDGSVLIGDVAGSIHVWNLRDRQSAETLRLTVGGPAVEALAWCPSGQTFVCQTKDGVLHLCSRYPLVELARTSPDRMFDAHVTPVFSRNGKQIVCALDTSIALLSADALKVQRTVDLPPDISVRCLRVSPSDLSLAALCSDGSIRVWDFPTMEPRSPLNVSPTRVSARDRDNRAIKDFAFHPSEPLLAGLREDGSCQLWDLSTARQIGAPFAAGLDGQWIAFTPDGDALVAMGDAEVNTWSVDAEAGDGPRSARRAREADARESLRALTPTSDRSFMSLRQIEEMIARRDHGSGCDQLSLLVALGEWYQERAKLFAERDADFDEIMSGFVFGSLLYRSAASQVEAMLEALAALEVHEWPLFDEWRSEFWQDDPAEFWIEIAWAGMQYLRDSVLRENLSEIVSAAEHAVRLTRRENVTSLNVLAAAYWHAGRKQEAIGAQRAALQLAEGMPFSSEVLDQMSKQLRAIETREPPSTSAVSAPELPTSR